MNLNVIKFPVICLSRDRTIDLVAEKEKLSVCSITAFKKNYFNKQMIYDHSGKLYKVAKAEYLQRLPLYWGWKKILTMPRMVKVKLLVEDLGIYSFDDLKSKIIKLLKSDSWYKGLSKDDAKEFIDNIQEVNDFDALYSVLKNWGI